MWSKNRTCYLPFLPYTLQSYPWVCCSSAYGVGGGGGLEKKYGLGLEKWFGSAWKKVRAGVRFGDGVEVGFGEEVGAGFREFGDGLGIGF